MTNSDFKTEPKIKIGGIYKHYKGNIYKVLGIGKHSETCEDMVVYQSQKDGRIWIRPIGMWNEYVSKADALRFTLIEE